MREKSLLTIKWKGLMLLSLIVPFIVLSLYSINNLVWLIALLVISNISYALNNPNKRIPYLLFNITIFVFLIGKLIVERIEGKELFLGYNNHVMPLVLLCILITLVSLTIGEIVSEKVGFKTKNAIKANWMFNEKVTSITLLLFYSSYIFSLYEILYRVAFVTIYSYSSYYLYTDSNLPYILSKFAELNRIIFVVLLCVEYRKNKIKMPIILYLISIILTLGTGQRNILILDGIMLMILMRYANERSLKYTGIRLYSPNTGKLLIYCLPLLVIFLGYWKFVRSGIEVDYSNIYMYFLDFFYSQGDQINFFANTIEYKNLIWSQNVPYTFSAPYNYIRNLFGLIDYGLYTRESAINGNTLATTQYYITSPGSLLTGSGSGSCYLSELYYDFGLLGIVIGNLFIGFVLGKLQINEYNSFYKNAFIILMLRNIIYIPRASFFDWISIPFNIWNVTMMVFLVCIFKIKKLKI